MGRERKRGVPEEEGGLGVESERWGRWGSSKK